MNRIAALAALAILGACASDPARIETPPSVARAGAEPERIARPASEREIRYYVDVEGMLWDDRGRNLGPAPRPSPAAKP